MPKPAKPMKKKRINITMKPDLLRKVDAVAGEYRRSEFIGDACEEKLDKDGEK